MKKRKLSKLQERLTAYHEAGHALAYYLFDIKLKFITIIPDFEKGELGRTQPVEKGFIPLQRFISAPSVLESRIDFERLIITSFAGYAAEIKYRHRQSKSLANINLGRVGKEIKLYSGEEPTSDGDFKKIRILFESFIHIRNGFSMERFEHESYYQWLWFRTANIISRDESWNAIDALAQVLLEKKEITGKQAEKILSKHNFNRLTTSGLHLTGEKMDELLERDFKNRAKQKP